MIGYIEGKIRYINDNSIIVVCGGVGYKIELGDSSKDLKKDVEASFFIHTHQRENELSLFGFRTREELEMFELLIDVSGIGPKGALQLVTDIGVPHLVKAILESDAEGLKVPGIGRKTAEKVILELRDKVEKGRFSSFESKASGKDSRRKLEEVADALRALGYTSRHVSSVVPELKRVAGWEKLSLQALIKIMLEKINK
ncbi:MAG: Holliday junction branch migration protein RuvA [Patescibacteria group bacterium]|nr:Holliday junction branch migration protein RuvA [Patescibacteria group bacterium]